VDDLKGKVAVVTGAASGIGWALAQRFASEGMKVVLADIEQPALDERAAELIHAGHDALAVVTDVSKPEPVHALRDQTLERFGAVHLLCNNAGVGGGGAMESLTEQDWQWVLGVNLWGVIHGLQAFLPTFVAQKEGHIVNTASVAGLFAAPFMGPYNASKFAVVAISEGLFHEMAMGATGVGVSVLCPSWVATQIALSDRNRPEGLQNPPAPEEVADPPAEGGMRDVLNNFIQTGMAAEEVADQVLDAVTSDRFYIITHESSIETITARMQAIVEQKSPPFAMP
jgi:NAD(P)-dependent dehydrogenase (short-subunit alcohol dehydrogenase family)